MLVILVEYQFISSVPGAAWLQVSHSTNLRANTLITYFLHHQASPALSARPDWGSRSHQPGLARSGQWAELHNRPIWSHFVHLNISSDKFALTGLAGLAGLVKSPNYEILVNTAVHRGLLQFLYRRHNVGQGQPGGPCLGQNTNILQRFDAQASTDQDRPAPASHGPQSATNVYIGPVWVLGSWDIFFDILCFITGYSLVAELYFILGNKISILAWFNIKLLQNFFIIFTCHLHKSQGKICKNFTNEVVLSSQWSATWW